MIILGWEAQSLAGPVLCALGVTGLLLGGLVYGVLGKPVVFRSRENPDQAPTAWERWSVHLLVIGAWSTGFGLIVWRGPAQPGWDVRLPGEAGWPVWPAAEWVYVTGYLTPLVISWLAPTRRALMRCAWELSALSLVSAVCFLALPICSPPRVSPGGASLSNWLLTFETGRADFAAASLPSFHVFWAMMLASVLSARGRWSAVAGWSWAVAMSMACVVNGAHAVADVAASWVIYPLVVSVMCRGSDRASSLP